VGPPQPRTSCRSGANPGFLVFANLQSLGYRPVCLSKLGCRQRRHSQQRRGNQGVLNNGTLNQGIGNLGTANQGILNGGTGSQGVLNSGGGSLLGLAPGGKLLGIGG
jgi:hypothetical protein